jgi:hypothetical protein
VGELINLGERKADTHQQACRHPGMSGTSEIVYWTLIEEGETLGAICGGSNGSVQWGR